MLKDAPPLPEADLCLRAAQALQSASGCAMGCDISVDKRLPSGAGMGGGSSDAATVLLALNRLWGLNWPRRRLQEIALPLGADVPFFIGGDNAWVEGIGERLTPLALRPHRLAVVKPPCHADTGTIFNSKHLVRQNEPAILLGFPAHDSMAGSNVESNAGAVLPVLNQLDLRAASPWPTDVLFHGFGRNDLQPAAEAEFPEVAQAAEWMRQVFGNSRMTGSGSAVFATLGQSQEGVDGDEGAHAAAETALQGRLETLQLPANWVFRVCRSLPAHPLRDWAPG